MRIKQRSFKEILASKPGMFGKMLQTAEQVQYLTKHLHAYLEPTLAEHSRVANFRAGCLVIAVDAAVWATRLRYLFPEILSKLRLEAGLAGLSSLRSIVDPSFFINPTIKRRSLSLAAKHAHLIKETANSISDPTLAQALLRLANNGGSDES